MGSPKGLEDECCVLVTPGQGLKECVSGTSHE